MTTTPEILSPAGNKSSFLAALAAGADAVYCGLREFSARMAAKNFTMEELESLTSLAHARGARVYVTLNTLVKPEDQDRLGRMVADLNRRVHPDALIIQDLAMVELARQVGFEGELHLSTLANVSFPAGLELVRTALGVDRVVTPRELNIDELKAMAAACPEGLHLETFIHGALCYAVSGRCYWSSYFGGKSGLRGRCVQPCRRFYSQGKKKAKFFSCQDLNMDVLAKVLLTVDRIRAWKIEGRKKSPHYVYYTVTAYRIFRDHVGDPDMKRTALGYLSRALGRPGTHYFFLPQRPQNPVNPDIQTGSGLFLGKIRGGPKNPHLAPREALLPGDVLRLGYEDEKWHGVYKVKRALPRRGKLHLKPARGGGEAKGVPVFLTDRREKA
ncbi:MAG: U32 family peptidase, partial [Desulfobacterales bacterium]|nr:U32 family peptidase [Desulfobacterales bacterium]